MDPELAIVQSERQGVTWGRDNIAAWMFAITGTIR